MTNRFWMIARGGGEPWGGDRRSPRSSSPPRRQRRRRIRPTSRSAACCFASCPRAKDLEFSLPLPRDGTRRAYPRALSGDLARRRPRQGARGQGHAATGRDPGLVL